MRAEVWCRKLSIPLSEKSVARGRLCKCVNTASECGVLKAKKKKHGKNIEFRRCGEIDAPRKMCGDHSLARRLPP